VDYYDALDTLDGLDVTVPPTGARLPPGARQTGKNRLDPFGPSSARQPILTDADSGNSDVIAKHVTQIQQFHY
jgi:hypothetical protein